jgi:hypothetical protein
MKKLAKRICSKYCIDIWIVSNNYIIDLDSGWYEEHDTIGLDLIKKTDYKI